MRRRGLLSLCLLVLASAPALADPAPPAGAARLAGDPALLDRFMAAAMDGPPYYNFMQLPVDAGRMARVADGQPLNYFNWSDLTAEDPPVIARVRELTGLADDPLEAGGDNDPLIVFEVKPSLDTPRPQISVDPPFYVQDPKAVPDAACGCFVMSVNPLKPREISFMTIRMVEAVPPARQQRCLAQMVLRAMGLAGLPEVASGTPVPADADPGTMLTPEEELFLWLAYRIPVGADREATRQAAARHLARLAQGG